MRFDSLDTNARDKEQLNNIPDELKARAQWINWRYELHDGRKTKVPYSSVRLTKIDAHKPRNWATFEVACKAIREKKYDGIGFVLTETDPYLGVDVDDCIDYDGNLSDAAIAIVKCLNSYTEVSPSGYGLRIIVTGELPKDDRKNGNFEVYATGRYLTFTGRHLSGTPRTIEHRPTEVLAFHAKYIAKDRKRATLPAGSAAHDDFTSLSDYFIDDKEAATWPKLDDDEVLRRTSTDRGADLFNQLWAGLWKAEIKVYPSPSEADLALASKLWYYATSAEQVERLMWRSSLKREKWSDRPDYLTRTIVKARQGLAGHFGSTRKPGGGRGSFLIGFDANEKFVEKLDELTKSGLTLTKDEAGLYKFKRDKEDDLFTPAQVYASSVSEKPIEAFAEITPGVHALWKIRALFESGFIPKPSLELEELPSDADKYAFRLWTGFKLVLQCKQIYQETDQITPTTYAIRFAVDWCPTTIYKATVGIGYLKEKGYLLDAGKDDKGTPLYLPSSIAQQEEDDDWDIEIPF